MTIIWQQRAGWMLKYSLNKGRRLAPRVSETEALLEHDELGW
jgi:hypothetical protein